MEAKSIGFRHPNTMKMKTTAHRSREADEQLLKRMQLFNEIKDLWDLKKIDKQQMMKVLLLDNHNSIIKTHTIEPVQDVNPVKLLTEIKGTHASKFVVAENRSNGDIFPKPDSLHRMDTFKTAGRRLGLPLYDYLLFSRSGYFSYAKNHFKTKTLLENYKLK